MSQLPPNLSEDGGLGNTDRDPCAHHAPGLKSAPDARRPCHELVSLGVWDEAAVVAPGQGGRQVPNMECSHHDRDGPGVMWIPRLRHQETDLRFERAARRRDRHAALTEQLADFLRVELLADDLDLFIQWHGEPGG